MINDLEKTNHRTIVPTVDKFGGRDRLLNSSEVPLFHYEHLKQLNLTQKSRAIIMGKTCYVTGSQVLGSHHQIIVCPIVPSLYTLHERVPDMERKASKITVQMTQIYKN